MVLSVGYLPRLFRFYDYTLSVKEEAEEDTGGAYAEMV
jgi:hypothetical protein